MKSNSLQLAPAAPTNVSEFPSRSRTSSEGGQISVNYNIGRLIGTARAVLWESADRLLAAFDLTTSQWMVIINLYGHENVTAADICKATNYDAGAMTRLIDRLVEKGLVRRVKKIADRRAMTLVLTRSGKALYRKLIGLVDEDINHLLDCLSEKEALQLEGLLIRIIERSS